jgi:cytochrome c peroxidase
MRLIGVASIVFVLALTFVMSGFGPGVTAQELAGQSGNDDERKHRDGQANGPQLLVAKGVEAEDVADARSVFDGRSGEYFHDGTAPDLRAVVNHYNRQFPLNLIRRQKADLVEFLKSL